MGLKKISSLSIDDLIGIAVIEEVCFSLDFWDFPRILYFTDIKFDNAFVVGISSKRKRKRLF